MELAEITGVSARCRNLVNRVNHGISGAVMVLPMLLHMGMPMAEAVQISTAIGNHEEQVGKPVECNNGRADNCR